MIPEKNLNARSINTVIISFIFLMLLLLQAGCVKEKFDPSNFDTSLNLHSGVAVPVGFSHMGFEKYLSDLPLHDELRIANDGFLSLIYSADIDSGEMRNLITINNISVNKSFLNQTGSVIFLNIPGTSFDLVDSIFIPITGTQAGAVIDSIHLLSGTLQMAPGSAGLTGTITFQSDGLRQNGTPFITTRNLTNPGFSLPLDNYTIVPEHDISGSNLLKFIISVHLQTPSGPVNPGVAVIDLQAGLSALLYETMYGDFGGYFLDFPAQSIPTPFFSQLSDGQIFFTDPKLKLFFSNSIGVPFGISFSRIVAIDRNNISYPLTGSGIPGATNPKIAGYPSLSQEGVTIDDSLVIDQSNSNLPDLIAINPDSIGIKASAEIVKLIPPSTTFIRYDSKYKISASIELPLWGKADFLVLHDTMDFNYLNSTMPPPEEIEKLIVRTSITNSFPVSVYPQIYLLDVNSVMIDSLFTGTEKIEGASDTDGDGKADPHKQAPIDIELPGSRIDNLLNTRYLLVKGRILTTDFPNKEVKLYSSYFLDYYVGLIALLKVNTGK